MAKIYLLEWRLYKGLSQEGLAEASGVDQSTIVRIERKGTGQPSTLLKLAAALGEDVPALHRPPIPVDTPKPRGEQSEEALIDEILSIRYRGDLSDEGVQKLTSELIKSLVDERRKGSGSEPANDRRGSETSR